MQTKKLYYTDPYLTDFSATVLSCTFGQKGFEIVLDQTAFYPEGGGQPCDLGVIFLEDTPIAVTQVKEENHTIVHYVAQEMPQGSTIKGKIDFRRRFDFMQQHTGEHILSGLINKEYGYDNVGFHLSEQDMYLDFSGPLTAKQIQEIVDKANQIILKNQPVDASFPSDITQLSYRSKKELTGDIRLVTAGEADVCACCGVHVATTGQVQMIAVKDFMNYKGGIRMFAACGERVYQDYMLKNQQCYDVSHLLSGKVTEVVAQVTRKIKECETLAQTLSQTKNALFEQWVAHTPCATPLLFLQENLTASETQKLATLFFEKNDTVVVISFQEDQSAKICLLSRVADTTTLGHLICKNLGGKGGGKPGMFQGTLQPPHKEIAAVILDAFHQVTCG